MVASGVRSSRFVLLSPLLAAVLAGPGCGARNLAERAPATPTFDPEGQTKCAVRRNHDKPLVVEWPSADRAELEARSKTQVVVVRYDGCEMELLGHCRAPGAYAYTAVTPKQDTLSIRTVDELYAQIPVGAAKLEGKLASAGELNVAMTMVGRLDASRPQIGIDELEGTCAGATHVMTGMTLGAFELFAGAGTEIGGAIEVRAIGAGARRRARKETLTRDGTPAACEGATSDAPPSDCSAPLRIEVAPLGLPRRSAATCPEGSTWDGEQCVLTEVVTKTETVCPVGARWDGQRCVREAVRRLEPTAVDAAALASEWDTLRGDANPGAGWFCFVGEGEDGRFGMCERDRIECGMTMGKRIEAGLRTKSQRCDKQGSAACFQARRTLEEGLRTFCFPEPQLCLDGHATVARRDDVEEMTECRVYE